MGHETGHATIPVEERMDPQAAMMRGTDRLNLPGLGQGRRLIGTIEPR